MPENPKTGFIKAWLMACCCHFGANDRREGEGGGKVRGGGERGVGGGGDGEEASAIDSRPSSAGSTHGLLMRDSLARNAIISHEPSFLEPSVDSSSLSAPALEPMGRHSGPQNSAGGFSGALNMGAHSGSIRRTGRGSVSFKRTTTSLAATLSAAMQAAEEPQGEGSEGRGGGGGREAGDSNGGLGVGAGMSAGAGGFLGGSSRQMSGQRVLMRQNSTALAVVSPQPWPLNAPLLVYKTAAPQGSSCCPFIRALGKAASRCSQYLKGLPAARKAFSKFGKAQQGGEFSGELTRLNKAQRLLGAPILLFFLFSSGCIVRTAGEDREQCGEVLFCSVVLWLYPQAADSGPSVLSFLPWMYCEGSWGRP